MHSHTMKTSDVYRGKVVVVVMVVVMRGVSWFVEVALILNRCNAGNILAAWGFIMLSVHLFHQVSQGFIQCVFSLSSKVCVVLIHKLCCGRCAIACFLLVKLFLSRSNNNLIMFLFP